MTCKLTSSRLSALRRCLRLHFYRYELGLSRIRTATPLRFGSAFHKGLELRSGIFGSDTGTILGSIAADYQTCPQWADPTDWAVERETLVALLSGHFWRYGQDNLQFVAVEAAFEIPLVNPDTGGVSRKFTLAGKIDAIVRLPDGRLAVLEYKTAGEDIGPEADYWLRLRCDGQISHYVLAARAMGHDVATVIYDVTRKPTIRLRQNETPEAYGQRLLADIGERPDYYYQRREIPRLEDELAEYRAELWQQAQQLMEIRRRASRLDDPCKAHFRNVGKITCSNCEFANLCLSGARVDPASPPHGYQVLSDVNPELGEEATA
ncbi:MAG: PD-(D/E)XK nuclease family protein [Phycisphaerae bacterium]